MPPGKRRRGYTTFNSDDEGDFLETLVAKAGTTIPSSRRRVKTKLASAQHPSVAPPIPDASSTLYDHDAHESNCGYYSTCDPNEDNRTSSHEIVPGGIKVVRRTRNANSDDPLATWKLSFREKYLDALFLREGRGRHWGDGFCGRCHVNQAGYRCTECFGVHGLCLSCVKETHQTAPFHIIQQWKEGRFHKVSLRSLGCHFQVGHTGSDPCPFPIVHPEFVVIDVSGIHTIDVSFCGCLLPALPVWEQLISIGWYPATPLQPNTAATNTVLRLFHILNLQAKLPPTDFIRGLEQIMDGFGLESIPRLAQFMLIVREWRNLLMLKREGRAHMANGIATTDQGELRVACRACPHPGINLPVGWENVHPERRFLYSWFLAQDANFKQKSRLRRLKRNAGDAKDPEMSYNQDVEAAGKRDPALGPGWGTFVSHDPYKQHLKDHPHQSEISHCVGFEAMTKANSKKNKGLRATGIGAVSCARHEILLKMADLTNGERYVNMDYVLLSAVKDTQLKKGWVSYDIACQWAINLFGRFSAMPTNLQPPGDLVLNFLVPKFHLPAHTSDCHGLYSFNFANGVGRTDGEGIERIWAWFNGIARSVSLMSAGGRYDTLDDFANFFNHHKMVTLSNLLLRRLTLAIPEAIIHHRAFIVFTEVLKVDKQQKMKEWETQVIEWESDHTLPCPYDVPRQIITFAEVKCQLSEEDLKRAERHGIDSLVHSDDMTTSSFVALALEIEELQIMIAADVVKAKTPTQQHAIQQRQTALVRKIEKLQEQYPIFMPGLHSFLHPSVETSGSPTPVSNNLRSEVEPDEGASSIPAITDAGLSEPNEAPSIPTIVGTKTGVSWTHGSVAPEKLPLYFPSSIPTAVRNIVSCKDAIHAEERLREGAAHERLAGLRCQLARRAAATKYKNKNPASQGVHTRFRTLTDNTEAKIKTHRDIYCRHREALLALRGRGDWEKILQVLKPTDVRGMHERTMREEEMAEYRRSCLMAGMSSKDVETLLAGDENIPVVSMDANLATGEGHRTLSWIWYTSSEDDAEVLSLLRVEWVKARARAQRWREELLLLEEEMRRSIEYCHWKGAWWRSQCHLRPDLCPAVQEGLVAYAEEHAAAEEHRATLWTAQWSKVRSRASHVVKQQLGPLPLSIIEPPELEVILEVEDEGAIEGDGDEDIYADPGDDVDIDA